MMKSFVLAAATSVFAVSAHAGTVDFSTLPSGTALTTFDFLDGAVTGTASADGNSPSSPDVAVVFNTDLSDTSDPDLESPFTLAGGTTTKSFGNAVIIQENAADDNGFTPDDDGKGGVLTFAFDDLLTFCDFYLLDVLTGTTVTLYDGDTVVSTLTTTINADSPDGSTPNLYTVVGFDGAQGTKFEIDFNGRSGGLGQFEVTPVPVPAAGLLLLGALGGLGVASRRKS